MVEGVPGLTMGPACLPVASSSLASAPLSRPSVTLAPVTLFDAETTATERTDERIKIKWISI